MRRMRETGASRRGQRLWATSCAFAAAALRRGLSHGGVVASCRLRRAFPEEINEVYRADVRRMLPLWERLRKNSSAMSTK